MSGTWEKENIPENPNWIQYDPTWDRKPEKERERSRRNTLRSRMIEIIKTFENEIFTPGELARKMGGQQLNSGARNVFAKLVAEGIVIKIKNRKYQWNSKN